MYRRRSYRRKKSKKGKLLFVLAVLTIITAKTYDVGFSPKSAVAEKNTFTAIRQVPQIPTEKPIFETIVDVPVEKPKTVRPSPVGRIAFNTTGSITSDEKDNKDDDLNEVYNDSEFMVSVKFTPGNTVEDRKRLNDILCTSELTDTQRTYLKIQLSQFSDKWLFNRNVAPGDELCEFYKVAPGDVLSSIARQYDIPYGIIMRLNNIKSPQSLRAGASIKVVKGPFHCMISRSAFTMDLYLQGTFVRNYPIGLGKPGMETPTGEWIVKSGGKMISPPWTDPDSGRTYSSDDPDYPLGTRWIGLEGISGPAEGRDGFAIHGSNDPDEIGKAVSRGCVRMHNEDVELIYDLLKPGKSKVMISD